MSEQYHSRVHIIYRLPVVIFNYKIMTQTIENIEEHIFHFGLDELEVYGTFKDESFIASNEVKIINWFYIRRHHVEKYMYKLVFFQDEHDFKANKNALFAYYKWIEAQAIPTLDYVVVYWTGFRLLSEDRILFFLDQFYLIKTKRFDIAIDLDIKISSVLDEFETLKQRWATFNGQWWEIETRYIWEKQKTKNKRQLIRVYNKIADITSRKKNEIYADYLLNNDITRIELEVRSELAKNMNYVDLFNTTILLWIFKNYLHKHTSLFHELPWNNTTLYVKKYEKIDPELYQSTYYRDKRRKIFLWHAKLIFNLWYCPIRVLIAEWLIKESTQMALWVDSFKDLLDQEKIVRAIAKEEKYTRENLEEILHNYYKYGN